MHFSPSLETDQSLDIWRQVFPNFTTMNCDLFIVDNGTPRRGTIVTVNITLSNTCLIDDEFGAITYDFTFGSTVDNTYGVYLRIPKYYAYTFRK